MVLLISLIKAEFQKIPTKSIGNQWRTNGGRLTPPPIVKV